MSRSGETVTVIVPTLNCADRLEKCLRSARWVDEVIIVDMGSTDDTLEVAKRFNARIYNRIPQDGNFDQNRKFGMTKASCDWVLKLDSDEILSPALQREIQRLLKNDNHRYNGFNLYNRIFMFGRQIKHGFVKSDSHELRLVRNGYWHYDPYRFHQQITVNGNIGFLKGYYDHHNILSVSEFIDKMNRYTEVDSKYYTTNISIIAVLLAPVKTFCKLFFWQLGFLDGGSGLIVCNLFATYSLVEKIKVWQLQNL